jgi:SAM-dependent methyltransferase
LVGATDVTRGRRYEQIGHGYATTRREDPRIAAAITAALGDARTIVNVGAGAGSYEPRDRHVLAVEPSDVMASQRPADRAPAIRATAGALPLRDGDVDAAMAILTVHHWDPDQERGVRELRRVARGPVAVLTFDLQLLADFWLIAEYLPEALDDDRERFPDFDRIASALGGATIASVPVPCDCTDGFFEAYYSRPEKYLDAAVRAAQSVWTRMPRGAEERCVSMLGADLESGAWDAKHGQLRDLATYDGGLRLIVSDGR